MPKKLLIAEKPSVATEFAKVLKVNGTKKNGFIEGALIATISVVVCKILGLIYVIPFYAIIGEQGGALYGYAYSIYSIFLGISQAGIPLAISKIVSEYNTLWYYYTKEKVNNYIMKFIKSHWY